MRILWLAAADARGHLMRAHLVEKRLARSGLRVDVMTTSEEGRAFLAALGTPARLLSSHYRVAFDDRQNMARARTEACILKYLFAPTRGATDLARLGRLALGYRYVVNDFHPLLLLAGSATGFPPVVHVYGENLFRAIEHHLDDRAPAIVADRYSALVRSLRDRAFARIEHTLDVPIPYGEATSATSFRLPPIVAAPKVCRPERPLAAVYLNPHFRDPTVAAWIEAALAERGLAMHAVGEGFAARPGWRAYDPHFVDAVAVAEVLVSAPGMGAVALSRYCGTPLWALVTDQPEQRDNLRFLRPPSRAVRLGEPLFSIPPPHPPLMGGEVIRAVQDRWAEVLMHLALCTPTRRRRAAFVHKESV
ncbi:MAG TPA: hypothetical protein VFB62_27890 [Polyangiaceae bacterium]|nr:hypothetical protein [Polyangiaceae bacterium]